MANQSFTIAGSTLSLLQVGERGIVTRIKTANETLMQRLRAVGVVPGTVVTLERRSPHYLIRVGDTALTLRSEDAHAIYVRLAECPKPFPVRSLKSQPFSKMSRFANSLLAAIVL